MILVFAAYSSSVSYTHLDVYKRQALCGSTVFADTAFQIFKGVNAIPPKIIESLVPVSYTHLDVYKRQPPVIEVKGKLMLPLFAHSRHIVFPPVLVYGFGGDFRQNYSHRAA